MREAIEKIVGMPVEEWLDMQFLNGATSVTKVANSVGVSKTTLINLTAEHRRKNPHLYRTKTDNKNGDNCIRKPIEDIDAEHEQWLAHVHAQRQARQKRMMAASRS